MAKRGQTSVAATVRAERAVQALEMKARGWSFREIAAKLGISHQHASDLYWEERAKLKNAAVEASAVIDAHRDEQVDRVLSIIKAWLPRANGTLEDPDNPGCFILDRDAAAIVAKNEEILAKLLGTNAPTKTDLTSKGEALGVVSPEFDLSKLSRDNLAAIEAIYSKAGVLRLPSSDEAA